jgi:cell division transport system permease protein
MTIALVVVVAISLSLLGTGLMFVQQVNQTRSFWQGKVQLSVYLCTKFSASPQCTKNGAASPAEIASIHQTLAALPQVMAVTYVSQPAGYQQFKTMFPAMASSVTPESTRS